MSYNRRAYKGPEPPLRQHDQQFFDSFMLVIGILMGVGVGLFFLVRAIAIDTQGTYIKDDPAVQAAIEDRIKPVGKVLLAGAAELEAAAAAAVSTPAPVATVMTGPQVYNAACIVCHAPPGVGGAPPLGDAAAWGPRIAKGLDTLHMHALMGFQGDKGFMPPKGGRPDLSDAEIMAAVDYITSQAKAQ
jgi:cytochrome c5